MLKTNVNIKNSNQNKIGYKTVRNIILPNNFYQKLFEAETQFQLYPTIKNCEELLSYYKQGAEYFTKKNSKQHTYFIEAIQKTISIQMSSKIIVNNNKEINSINQISNNKNSKKHWNPKIKNQINKFNLKEYDFKSESKKIISNLNYSIKKSMNLFLKNKTKQESNFRKNVEKKIFKTRLEKKTNKNIDKYNTPKKRRSFISISSTNLLKNNFQNHSDLKERRISYSNFRIHLNFHLNNEEHINRKREFLKQDLSNDIIYFLKNYNKKFYFLFQNPLNKTLNKLNTLIEDSYSKMKNKYLDYEEDLKGFMALSENIEDEGIKNLISSLKSEFKEDLILMKKEQEESINSLVLEMKKNNLLNNISIRNLNSDTIAQIAEVFK